MNGVFAMADDDLAGGTEGRTLWYGVQLEQIWKEEIERAIDRVKNHKDRTIEDKRFRKMWYIVQARDRKRRVAEE